MIKRRLAGNPILDTEYNWIKWYDCMILVYNIYIYIGVTYQNDMMYDNVWHDIVWEGGGPETFKNHPTPSGTRNREELER